jgi:hypothetical protein
MLRNLENLETPNKQGIAAKSGDIHNFKFKALK